MKIFHYLFLYLIASIIAAGIIDYSNKKEEDNFFDSESELIGYEFLLSLFWPILLFMVIIRFFILKVSKICAFIDGIHKGITKK